MIIKCSCRSLAGLKDHVLDDQNELVRKGYARGLVFEDWDEAWAELTKLCALDISRSPVLHASFSVDLQHHGEARAFEYARHSFEAEYRLTGQPSLQVFHVKEGRMHMHMIYFRRDMVTNKLIPMRFFKMRNEKVARLVECKLGHKVTMGRHNRAVIAHLEREGELLAAITLRAANIDKGRRPVARKNHADLQQDARTGFAIDAVHRVLVRSWEEIDFARALRRSGYMLARGDRQNAIVLVDPAGGTHSVAHTLRKVGVHAKSAEIRERIRDYELPNVEEARHWQLLQNTKRVTDSKQKLRQIEEEDLSKIDGHEPVGAGMLQIGMVACRPQVEHFRARRSEVGEGPVQHSVPDWSSSRNRHYSQEWQSALDRIEDLGATEVVSVDDDGFEILARLSDRITLINDRTAPPSDMSICLMLAHVQTHWGGRCKLSGEIDFQTRAARMAAQHGIVVEELDPAVARILEAEIPDVENCDWDAARTEIAVIHF